MILLISPSPSRCSVSKELLGTQAHHTTIRKLLIQFIEHNGAQFSKITEIFGRPFEKHCELLKRQVFN